MALLVHKDQQDQQELKVLLDLKEIPVLPDPRELLDLKDQSDQQELKVLLDLKEILVLPDLRELLDLKDQSDQQELKVLPVFLELLAPLEPLDPREQVALMDTLLVRSTISMIR